jgi:hypothetical protein
MDLKVRRRRAGGNRPLGGVSWVDLGQELRMRGAWVRVLGVLSCCSLAVMPLGAQGADRAAARSLLVGELLVPAEREPIVCAAATDDEIFEIRRRGSGWFPTTEGVYALTFRAQLPMSKRTVTVGLDQGRRPRLLMAVWTLDDEPGGGTESVVVRFLPNGEVRDGRRTRRVSPRDSSVAAAGRTDLLPEDSILAYTLAREIGFRCERGLFDPPPGGEIWTGVRLP